MIQSRRCSRTREFFFDIFLAFVLGTIFGFAFGDTAEAATFIVTNDARMVSVMDSVQAGDIVQINDGAYTRSPSFDPQYKVSPATIAARITIIGNLTSPLAVSVPGFRGLGGCSRQYGIGCS